MMKSVFQYTCFIDVENSKFLSKILSFCLKSNNSPLDVVAKLKNLPLKNRNERAQTQKEEKGKKKA